MMKSYNIALRRAAMPELSGRVFDPAETEFCRMHEYAAVGSYVWDESGYKPETRAYVAWDEAGLHVLMCACEETVAAAETRFGGMVCVDSCLECFLQPFADDPRYLNFEVNAAGVAHIGLGSGRADRTVLERMPEGVNICASKHEGAWWAVAYTVPTGLLKEIYGRVPQAGDVMRGNFYKCDESIHPHFGTWNPVKWDHPDFHRPEFFGELTLEPASNP